MQKLGTARRAILKGALGAAAGVAFSRSMLGVAWGQTLPNYVDLPNLPGPGGLTMEDIRDKGFWPVPSTPPASGTIQTRQLAENTYLITGAGCNVVVVTTGGGAIVVDGGLKEHAQELLSAILALPGSGPVHTLFNTSWRPEYRGLNELVGAAGGRIIAHDVVRQWQMIRVIHPWDPDNPHPPLPAQARPNDTFRLFNNAPRNVEIAGVQIQYALLPQTHTDSSIYVYFPQANVAAIGGVLNGAGSSWEQTGDGYRGNWVEIDWWTGGRHAGLNAALQAVEQRTDMDTVFVPAQGRLLTRVPLSAQILASGRLGDLNLEDFVTERLLALPLEDANLGCNLSAQREMHSTINGSFNVNHQGRDEKVDAFLRNENYQQYIRVMGNPTVFVYRAQESSFPYVVFPNA